MFDGSERMLHRPSPQPHHLGLSVEPLLHRFQHFLMLPSRDTPVFAGRALGFERTARASRGPIFVYGHAILDRSEAPDSTLSGRTAKFVVSYDVDKVLFVKEPLARLFDVRVLGTIGVMPDRSHLRISSPLK